MESVHQAEGSSSPASPSFPISVKNTSCPSTEGTEAQFGRFLFPDTEVGQVQDTGSLLSTGPQGSQGLFVDMLAGN